MTPTDVPSRIAVVTGANRGIGHEIARQLVSRGLHVIATSRDEAAGRAAASDIGAESRRLDVTRTEDVEEFAAGIPALDVLVNNAGVSLNGFDAEVARHTLDANFYGPMRLTDRLLPRMRAGARIVMVSSGLGELAGLPDPLRARFEAQDLEREDLVALVESFVRDVAAGVHARKGWPSSAYRVSKIALNALTRILARELEGDPRAILVNAACPGWVRTRMGGEAAPRSPVEGAQTPVWLAMLPRGGPSGGFFRDEQRIAW
jgi:NAD(P)-dependent dehydrogenase (short-subunit alcohol dehydrogenase family)